MPSSGAWESSGGDGVKAVTCNLKRAHSSSSVAGESSGRDGTKAASMFSAAVNVSAEFRSCACASTSVQARASKGTRARFAHGWEGTRARLHTAGRSLISTH